MQQTPLRLTYDDFQTWIRALRYATKKHTLLNERLIYCNLKLTGGHGSSLDQPLTKIHTAFNPFLHWIERKDATQEELEEVKDIVAAYEAFSLTLNERELILLCHLILKKITTSELAVRLNISRTTLYQDKNVLLKKWVTFFSTPEAIKTGSISQ